VAASDSFVVRRSPAISFLLIVSTMLPLAPSSWRPQ
jgi:hypothetical protein